MKILVLSAHADDETFGMGATIKKLADEGAEINIFVLSDGTTAQYEDKKMIEVRRESCIKAGEILGVQDFDFLNFPDGKLDTISTLEITQKIKDKISNFEPNIIFTTPNNDGHQDHRKVHDCTLIASRPKDFRIGKIIQYELFSTIKTSFNPNLFIDISNEFLTKIDAIKQYDSEIESYPHVRSIEAVENLACIRGVESGFQKAEAFKIIRSYAL
tara:strand:- start:1048 stop:1692 length:645 start_codon:yes stop_codon:yes gene_type:complete